MSRPSSVSRVAVHLSVLESSVAWSRSVLHARCRICRRRGNPELMLLCDGCDRGHHTYCLKPPMKVRMWFHGGHLPGKSRECKSDEGGKVSENVFLHVVNYRKYCPWHKICKKGVLY